MAVREGPVDPVVGRHPAGALDLTGDLQTDEKAQEAKRHQPELCFRQLHAINAPPQRDGNDIVTCPHQDEGEGPQQRQMRMPNDPLGEMDQSVEALRRLEWPLDTGNEIEDHPGDDELQRHAFIDLLPVAAHRHEDVRDERQHRNEERSSLASPLSSANQGSESATNGAGRPWYRTGQVSRSPPGRANGYTPECA